MNPLAPMKLAVPSACKRHHRFYRESGTTTGCPYCLQAEVTLLAQRLEEGRAKIRAAVDAL